MMATISLDSWLTCGNLDSESRTKGGNMFLGDVRNPAWVELIWSWSDSQQSSRGYVCTETMKRGPKSGNREVFAVLPGPKRGAFTPRSIDVMHIISGMRFGLPGDIVVRIIDFSACEEAIASLARGVQSEF